MELGQRLRQARLEAGLSQRQLCGEEITRNMLSLIENGTAKPSMDTLRYLAARLGKPVGYFLEEQAVTSPNQAAMDAARQAYAAGRYGDCLQALEAYRGTDEIFDPERWLLEALSCMALAERSLEKPAYAAELLGRAKTAGERTPYYTDGLERQRLLALYQATPGEAKTIAAQLPDPLPEILLRAEAALADPARCGRILDSTDTGDARWHLLRGHVYWAQKAYAQAAEQYAQAEEVYPQQVFPRLEACYEALEDYKMAYHYARKRRNSEG